MAVGGEQTSVQGGELPARLPDLWREYRAKGTCTRCGAGLYARCYAAMPEETSSGTVIATYIDHVASASGYCSCGAPITPQSFDPDFTPKTSEIVYLEEATFDVR